MAITKNNIFANIKGEGFTDQSHAHLSLHDDDK